MQRSLFFIMMVLVLAGCRSEMRSRLMHVDSLLDQRLKDSAITEFSYVQSSEIDNDADRALYNLLYSRIIFINDLVEEELPNDSLIDYSISYYKREGNQEKLAQAYFYKGYINDKRNDIKAAIINFKKAEIIEMSLHHDSILHDIYLFLVYDNVYNGESRLALEYAKKDLVVSKNAKNRQWAACAVNNIMSTYHALGMMDSCLYYVDILRTYTDGFDERNKANYLCNIGWLLREDKPSEAERILNQSIKLLPNNIAYTAFSDIALMKNDREKAIKLLKKGLYLDERVYDVEILKRLSSIYQSMGKPEEALLYTNKMVALEDSMHAAEKKNNLAKIQLAEENKNKRKEKDNASLLLIVTIVFVTISVTVCIIFRHYSKNRKQKAIIVKLKSEMSRYRDLSAKKVSETTVTNEINQLYKEDYAKHSEEGRKLYNAVMNGRMNAVKFSPTQYNEIIQYYRTVNAAFNSQLDGNLRPLTPRSKFAAILFNENLDDSKIENILAISNSGLRSLKSRINKYRST